MTSSECRTVSGSCRNPEAFSFFLELLGSDSPKFVSADNGSLRVACDGIVMDLSMSGAEKVQRRAVRIAAVNSTGRIFFRAFKPFLEECAHDHGEIVWRDGFVDLRQAALVLTGRKDVSVSPVEFGAADDDQLWLMEQLGMAQSRFVDMQRRKFVMGEKMAGVHYNTYASVAGRLATPEVGGTVNVHSMPVSIRSAVRPWRPGRVFVIADIQSAEYVTLAWLCGCPRMRAMLDRGLDPHTMHAKIVFQPSDDDFEQARRYAKTVFFVMIYGGGVSAVAKVLDVEHGLAEIIVRKFEKMYPDMMAWREAKSAEAIAAGYVLSGHGRRLAVDSEDEAKRMAINFPVQSATSDLTTLATVPMRMPVGCWPIIHHHDAIVVDADVSMVDEVKHVLVECMSGASNPLISRLNIQLPYRVAIRVAESWG